MTLTRTYFQPRCQRQGHALAGAWADQWIGVDGGRSNHLAQLLAFVGVDRAFDPAAELVQRFLGVDVDGESVRRECYRQTAAAARFQAQSPAWSEDFVAAEGNIEAAVDAGKVNIREDRWRDFKLLHVLKRPAGQPLNDAAAEHLPTRRLPAPTVRRMHSEIASIDVFEQDWRPMLGRLGLTDWSALHVLGDGADWIWNAATTQWPGCRQTLDFFHAAEHLADATRSLHGEYSAMAKQRFESARGRLLRRGWAGVTEFVGEELTQADTPNRRQPLEKLLDYFRNHIGRLNYHHCLAEGRPIGSGAVEGGVKTLALRLCYCHYHPQS